MKLYVYIFVLLLAISCTTSQFSYIAEIGDNEMNEMTIEILAERLLSGEMSMDEFNELDLEIQNAIVRMTARPLTEREQEVWRTQQQALRRTHLNYIVVGNFIPAPADADLQTIERFVFHSGTSHFGFGLAIDIAHGRVYYEPNGGSFGEGILWLHTVDFFANFIEDDLIRLIQAIEASGLRNWDEFYQGEFDDFVEGGGTLWRVGIEFSDGTIMRSGGSGHTDFHPPLDQFNILTDFISTIGAEIEERHAAEAAQGE
jgi:hypothetical protein